MAAVISSKKFEKSYSLETHRLVLGKTLNNFRRSGHFCDVKLDVQGKEFSSHRVMLAGCGSSYFYNLFTIEMKEKQEGIVHIQGELQSEIMEDFLQFIYTGEVLLTTENAVKLLKAANYTSISGLEYVCQDFLKDNLTVESCFSFRGLAEKYNCGTLLDACNCFMKNHFSELANQPEFLEISEGELKSYLVSDDIVVEGEEKTYEALVSWVKHEPETRKKHFYELFCCIRLPSLASDYLTTTVAEEELVCNNQLCLKLALKTISSPNVSHKPRKCINSCCEAIMLCGGDDWLDDVTKRCVCYVPSTDVCHELASIPGGSLFDHGTCQLDGLLYVMGGKKNYTHPAQSSAYRYDPRVNSWVSIAPLLKSTYDIHSSAASLNGFVYVVAGATDEETLCDVQRYDPTTNSWQLVKPVITARENACVISDQQFLFAVGGLRRFPEGQEEVLNSCEKYDPRANTWVEISSMHTKRFRASTAILNSKIYILGGEINNMGTITSLCEMYTISSETWTDIAQLQEPRVFGAAGVIDGQIYILGGKNDEFDNVEVIERYDEERREWKFASIMKRNNFRFSASVLKFAKTFLEKCPEASFEEYDSD